MAISVLTLASNKTEIALQPINAYNYRMSLCVAWRWEDAVTLATDSRLSGPSGGSIDCAPKLFDLPIRVVNAFDSKSDQAKVIFEKRYGFCFSGQFLTAYIVTQWISTILSNLQFIGHSSDLTFVSLMKIFTKVHVLAEKQLTSNGEYGFQTDFLVVGTCPKTGASSVWLSDHDKDQGVKGQEALLDRPFSHISIGSGAEELNGRLGPRLEAGGVQVNLEIPRMMENVIQSGRIPSVGGPLQLGQISSRANDFTIFGTGYYPERGECAPTLTIRGIDGKAFGLDPLSGFGMSYSYLMPFEIPKSQLF